MHRQWSEITHVWSIVRFHDYAMLPIRLETLTTSYIYLYAIQIVNILQRNLACALKIQRESHTNSRKNDSSNTVAEHTSSDDRASECEKEKQTSHRKILT